MTHVEPTVHPSAPSLEPVRDLDGAAPKPAAGPHTQPGRASVLRRFLSVRQVRWGIFLVFVMTLVAFCGHLVAPFSPTEPVSTPYAPPGDGLLLGADQLGRDVLSRVLSGGAYLAWMAPVTAVVGVFLGALVGMLAAYFGGWVDTLLMRFMDVLLAFPGILMALLFVSMLGPSPLLLVLLVIVALIPGVARVIRGATLPIVNREYVLWARAVGVKSASILTREVLPNITSPLLVELGIRLMWAVGILASISFIGYGIQPPTPDWGLMVSENRTGLATQPFAVLAPIVMIALFTIGGNLIAEGGARVIARTEGN